MNKIQLKNVDLRPLASVAAKIKITLANSVTVIDELGGNDFFEIEILTDTNQATKINEDSDLSLIEQYTNSEFSGIYSTYEEYKSFEGFYSITCTDENRSWTLEFESGEIQFEDGDLTEEETENLINTLDKKNIYLIASEVLSFCKK